MTDVAWREGPVGFTRDVGNEQTAPLAAGGTFVGEWARVGDHAAFCILYASNVAPATLQVQWSADGITQDTSAFGASNLRVTPISGFQVAFTVHNIMVRPWYRLRVVNGPTPQLLVFGFNGILAAPYTGTFSGIGDPLSILSVALLTRSVLIGDQGAGNYAPVRIDKDKALQVSSIQIKDAGNSFAAPTVLPTPTAPFVGIPFPTLDSGVIGTTFSVVGPAGKSGTIIFNYSSTPNQALGSVPVRVPLHITDLSNPLLVPLQNVESYFWLEFVPDDDTLTWLAIACVHQKTAPPTLSRFLSQTITDNEAVGSNRVFMSARKADGTWPAVGFGQQLRAASLPVTLAVDQPTIPTSLDAETLTALETITVANFPAVQPVSGTVVAVPATFSKAHGTGTGAAVQIKTGPGVLHAVVLKGGSTFVAYDAIAGTTGKFLDIGGTAEYTGPFDIAFTLGLRIVVQSTKLYTVIYS